MEPYFYKRVKQINTDTPWTERKQAILNMDMKTRLCFLQYNDHF